MKIYPLSFLTAVLAFLALNPAARAQHLVCDGILGNSGEQGQTLVLFGAKQARGLGVVYDKYGTLWDRGGSGALNRYALPVLKPIRIVVKNGHVTLEGAVDNEMDKHLAGMRANGVHGVFSVTNNLQVEKTTAGITGAEWPVDGSVAAR